MSSHEAIALTNLIAEAVQVVGHQNPAVILADAALHYKSTGAHNARAMGEAHRNLQELLDNITAPLPTSVFSGSEQKPVTPLFDRATEKWKACGLTPAQTRTELETFAQRMEVDRATLVETLRQLTDRIADPEQWNPAMRPDQFRLALGTVRGAWQFKGAVDLLRYLRIAS